MSHRNGKNIIRQLDSGDSKAYYEIRLAGLKLHPEAFGTGAEDWSKATDTQIIELLEKSSRDDFVLGHFQDGKLIGVIGLKREKKHSVAHKGTVWGFFVMPDFRKRGIGEALLKALIEKTSSHEELKHLRAVVTVTRLNVAHLFESSGFTKYGLEPRGIKEGSNFYDQSYLMLKLRD